MYLKIEDSHESKLINKWLVGKSILCEGTPIPSHFQMAVLENLSEDLPMGKSTIIKVIFEKKTFQLKLQNQQFSKKKYKNHVPIIRIMYGKGEFSDFLKNKFKITWNWLQSNKRSSGRFPRVNRIPQNVKEYLALYSSNKTNTFFGKCFQADEINDYHENFIDIQDEETVELQLNYSQKDYNSTIKEKLTINKVRHLDRSLINNIKQLYEFKCQICGESFIDRYQAKIAEAHHIIPFVKSYNNDSDNLLIVCPNHHRIIHKVNPRFNKTKRLLHYANGLEEKLLINKHL